MDSAEEARLARRAQYEEQLRRMLPRGTIYMTYGGDTRRALQVLISEEKGRGEHYVYLHRGADDEVFYVGKGRGNRAYSRDRDEMWHHYLETHCDGRYEVEIVKYFETDGDALDLETDMITLFGDHLVNTINPLRGMDYEVNAHFHKLRKANWSRISAATDLLRSDPGKAESAFRLAIAGMAEYARLDWERGFYADLIKEIHPDWSCHLNGQDLFAINQLTLLLKSQARWDELIAVTDLFLEMYPETRQQGLMKQVVQRSEAARAKHPTGLLG